MFIQNSKDSSVLAFLEGPIQPLRPRHRTRRGSGQARVQEKAALGCWRRRRSHAIRRRRGSATSVIAVPATVLPAVVGEVEGGGGGRGVPPSLHQAWKLAIWKVHFLPGHEMHYTQDMKTNWKPVSFTVIATTSRWFHSAASSRGEMWPANHMA